MTEEQDKPTSSGGRWFRLPKLFAETQDLLEDAEATAKSLGVEHDPASDALAEAPSAVSPKTASPRGVMATSEAPAAGAATTPPSGGVPAQSAAPARPVRSTGARALESGAGVASTEGAAPVERPVPAMISAQAVVTEIDALRDAMEQVFYVVSQINERETSQEKVFNTLHDELRDYKTDFIYEHLKPVVRSLLFLYDSLEQFDVEIAGHELPAGQERRGTLSPSNVRENIVFFRDQLVETLQLCEVARMETPEGVYNAKLHKVIEVVPVEDGENNVIQRVVRSGWYLNGQLLRPAEVVIGKTS